MAQGSQCKTNLILHIQKFSIQNDTLQTSPKYNVYNPHAKLKCTHVPINTNSFVKNFDSCDDRDLLVAENSKN